MCLLFPMKVLSWRFLGGPWAPIIWRLVCGWGWACPYPLKEALVAGMRLGLSAPYPFKEAYQAALALPTLAT